MLTVPRRLPDAVPSGPVLFKRILWAVDFSASSMPRAETCVVTGTRSRWLFDSRACVNPRRSLELVSVTAWVHQCSQCRGRTTRAARCAVVRRAAPVRGATARMRCLISAHAASMGLKSCEYRRQEADRGAGLLDQRADASRFVRGQIVEHDDVSATQARHEPALHPLGKPRRRHRAPGGAPSSATDRRASRRPASGCRPSSAAAARPLTTPEAPTRASAPSPDWRPIRREKTTRRTSTRPEPVAEGAPLPLDYRTVLLGRPRALFLKTYPVRCNARNTLDRWTCASGAARSLYTRVNSWVVRSGQLVDQGMQRRDVDRRVPSRRRAARAAPSRGRGRLGPSAPTY